MKLNLFEIRLYGKFISGYTAVEVTKYPMAVLGGKSKPKLKNLKSFIKVEISYNKFFC